MATHKRRLIPIVDRGFQFKYTAIIMGVAALVSTILGYFLLDAYTEMNSMIEISDEIGQQLNADDARRVFIMVVGFLGAEVIVLGVLGLVITHRVCGPIFVLARHLNTIREGSYPAVRPLRSGDEFRACFDVFAETVETLRDRDDAEIKTLEAALASENITGDHRAALEKMVAERKERVGPIKG